MTDKRKDPPKSDEESTLLFDESSSNKRDENRIPLILNGKLYTIQELKPNQKVSAVCCMCKKNKKKLLFKVV